MNCKEVHIGISNKGGTQSFTVGEPVPAQESATVYDLGTEPVNRMLVNGSFTLYQMLSGETEVFVETSAVEDGSQPTSYTFFGGVGIDTAARKLDFSTATGLASGEYVFSDGIHRLEAPAGANLLKIQPGGELYLGIRFSTPDSNLWWDVGGSSLREFAEPSGICLKVSARTAPGLQSMEVSENYARLCQVLETRQFWVNRLQVTGTDRDIFEIQALKAFSHISKSANGVLSSKNMYFRRTSRDSHPTVELVFASPLPLGRTSFLRFAIEAGFEGTLSLCLSEKPEKQEHTGRYREIKVKTGCPCHVPLFTGLMALAAAVYMKNK